ncbi:MAG TPA: glycosyltransferase family 9 protein [Bacteroidales bacterium]|nr:glycosyltransferase family 9 protein [Bacteroidales bacterium]
MVSFQRFIDKYLGYVIVLFLYLFRIFDRNGRNDKKFLIIKLWALGDSVLTLSLIRGIKETYNGSMVDVLMRTRVKDVYESFPLADHIYNLDSSSGFINILKKMRKYDVVFDCEPYFNLSAALSFLLGKKRIGFSRQLRSCLYNQTVRFRKDQHMVQNYLDMLRVLGKQYDTRSLEKLTAGPQERISVDEYVSRNLTGKTIIGITPGVAESSKNRMWFEERFAELSDRLIRELDAEVVFIDSQANADTVTRIILLMNQQPLNTQGLFSLKETFYLISKCDVYISNDTGPMHIAAAQGCRTIGLFGPNTPVLWGPYGSGNISIYKTPLEPAIQNDKGIFKNVNRDGYMGPITVEDVFDAVKKCLR